MKPQDKQMVNNVLKLTLVFLLLTDTALWAQEERREDAVFVKKCSGGYTLTISATNVLLGKLLRELAEKCSVAVMVYEKAVLSRPMSVHFKDLSIEEGIKRVLRAAGIKNHLIRYGSNGNGRPEPSEVVLLGSGGKGGVLAFAGGKGERETGNAGSSRAYGDLSPEDMFMDKVESLKARYQWEDEGMRELVDYLLWIMPDPAKGPGLDALIKALDRRMDEGDKNTVDEELFYRAIGDTVPSHIEPLMMESIRSLGRNYKGGKETDGSEKSPDQLYREFMKKNRSNPDRAR